MTATCTCGHPLAWHGPRGCEACGCRFYDGAASMVIVAGVLVILGAFVGLLIALALASLDDSYNAGSAGAAAIATHLPRSARYVT